MAPEAVALLATRRLVFSRRLSCSSLFCAGHPSVTMLASAAGKRSTAELLLLSCPNAADKKVMKL